MISLLSHGVLRYKIYNVQKCLFLFHVFCCVLFQKLLMLLFTNLQKKNSSHLN